MDYKEEKRIVFTGTDAASKKLDLLLFGMRFVGTFGIWLFVGLAIVLIYWNFEEDPLTIETTQNTREWVYCKDRIFEFERYVKTTKFLTVQVSQELKDLSTGQVFGMPAIPPYSGEAGERTWTYKKEVPLSYKDGAYEYIPTLTYVVNPIQTITKQGPSQKVIVKCDTPQEEKK